MESNLQDRIDLLHQQAAGFYLQGEFQDALDAWQELLRLDGEDERAQEGVRLCEMLADENIQHQSIQELMSSPAPQVGSDAESYSDAAMLSTVQARSDGELDALEQLLDDQLGVGQAASQPVGPAFDPVAPSDEDFGALNFDDDEVPTWKADPEFEPMIDPSAAPEPSPEASTEAPKAAPAPRSLTGVGLRPDLDAGEAAAASRAAEAEVQRRIVELMAEVRSALDAKDPDHALKVVKRVLILDDTHTEALRIRTEIEGGPVESFSAGAPDFSGDVGLTGSSDGVPEFESTGYAPEPTVEPTLESTFESTSFTAPAVPVEEDLLAGVSFDDDAAAERAGMPSFEDSVGASAGDPTDFVETPPVHGAEPIGQEGELPPDLEGVHLAANPDDLRSRNEDAQANLRSDAAARVIEDFEDDSGDDPDRHAALNKAAAKLAKIKADDAANVSVRRLSRGLVMGLMVAVILVVVAIVGIKAIDGFAGEVEGPATPAPSAAAKKSTKPDSKADAAAVAAEPVATQADVDQWLEQAGQANAAAEYAEAIRLYDRVLRARPEHPVAKASIQASAARFQEQQNLARKELEAFRSFERGDYRSALRAFYRLPAETGKNYDRQIANGWFNMCVVGLQNGNCSNASEAYKELRAANSTDPSLAGLGRLVEACPTNQGGPAFLRAVAGLSARGADD